MDDIFQPILSIATTDTMMYVVGFVEFVLSFGFALLWFICFSNYELQSSLARKAIIANAVGWLLLVCLGLFFIPHERIGSYLDVYANLALTNIVIWLIILLSTLILLLVADKHIQSKAEKFT